MNRKITFIGDSFVKGVGDSEKGGWTRRAASELGQQWEATHRGVGGDNIRSVLNRFPNDVPNAHQTLVVHVGMNDSRTRPSLGGLNEVPKREFSVALLSLHYVARAKRANPMILMGLTPVDQSRTTPYKEDKIYANKEVRAYDRLIRDFARSRKHVFVPLYDQILAAGGPTKFTADGVHPSPEGHALIAQRFLSFFSRLTHDTR